MLKIIRTDAKNEDFIELVRQLDKYLSVADGDDHAFYDQYNKIDSIKYAIVVYKNSIPVGCGAIKQFDSESMEVKRMFVPADYRGKGVASQVLLALEEWAKELGNLTCVLETGKRQIEAIALYHKNEYQIRENYGQYKGVENSVCFEKRL